MTGLPGRFEPSPIDTYLFAPGVPARVEPARFVVGRLSRDDPVKFHPGAAGFFRTLASQGCEVKLMGATPILPALGGANGITVLPQNSAPAVDFLRTLDCFTYRTHPSWTEAWGRVVTEAMSVGIPVVAHADGGYAQIIRHGENGFSFTGIRRRWSWSPNCANHRRCERRCARTPHHSRPLRDERIRTFRPLLSPVRPATRLIGISD